VAVHPHPEQTLAPGRARSMVRATVWERAAGFAFPWRSYNTDSPPQAQQPTLSPFVQRRYWEVCSGWGSTPVKRTYLVGTNLMTFESASPRNNRGFRGQSKQIYSAQVHRSHWCIHRHSTIDAHFKYLLKIYHDAVCSHSFINKIDKHAHAAH